MPAERVLSSYILRLTQRLSRLSIGLQDVRTGETLYFENFEALSVFLESNLNPKTPLRPDVTKDND
jgi:hypothetical protein